MKRKNKVKCLNGHSFESDVYTPTVKVTLTELSYMGHCILLTYGRYTVRKSIISHYINSSTDKS